MQQIRREVAPRAKLGIRRGGVRLFLLGVVVIAGAAAAYLHLIPSRAALEVEQRAQAAGHSFASTVLGAVVARNNLRVNSIAGVTAQLPDVAYVAVINQQGSMIAGVFGDLSSFDGATADRVRRYGIPQQFVNGAGEEGVGGGAGRYLEFGGREIFAVAEPVGDTGAVAYLGLFSPASANPLWGAPLILILLLAVCLLGVGMIIILTRSTLDEGDATPPNPGIDRGLSTDSGGEL